MAPCPRKRGNGWIHLLTTISGWLSYWQMAGRFLRYAELNFMTTNLCICRLECVGGQCGVFEYYSPHKKFEYER